MEHTKGRLSVYEHRDSSGLEIGVLYKDAVFTNGEVAAIATISGGRRNGVTDTQRANARRLVACWNAAEGIPTETLENGHAVFGKLAEATADRDRLQALNAELVAIMQTFVDDYKQHPQRLGAGSKASAHYSACVAALAKAKETVK